MSKKQKLEFEWKTKQSRMIADLYKTFEDVLDANNLFGKLDVETKRDYHKPTIGIVIMTRESDNMIVEFLETITMGDESYSEWVNKILALRKKLEKFGKEY